jgi:hypothetical protein
MENKNRATKIISTLGKLVSHLLSDILYEINNRRILPECQF